jgi:4-hydroxy-4-methyl-2-oxoglutarate aldolase
MHPTQSGMAVDGSASVATDSLVFTSLATVRVDFERVSDEIVGLAQSMPAATLHEAAGKTGALPAAIKPVVPAFCVCGPALTVHSPPADNLWLHRALAIAQPGDVLVVYTSDAYEYGYWGEVMSTAARYRKLGGLVIDGCVRDLVLLQDIGFPVFARGLCIRGTGKDFAARGWLNAPLRIGEVTVNAGDLIAGDADGVVVVPRGTAARVVEAAKAREEDESRVIQRLGEGELSLDIYGWNR